jgi:hypothetical protein
MTMDYRDLIYHEYHFPYREKELHQRADQERLALIAESNQRRMRFYYPAMVGVGRWLIASGLHLQKRYGDWCELPAATPSNPAPRNA